MRKDPVDYDRQSQKALNAGFRGLRVSVCLRSLAQAEQLVAAARTSVFFRCQRSFLVDE